METLPPWYLRGRPGLWQCGGTVASAVQNGCRLVPWGNSTWTPRTARLQPSPLGTSSSSGVSKPPVRRSLLPDALARLLPAVHVAAEPLPGQPAHRRGARQPVLQPAGGQRQQHSQDRHNRRDPHPRRSLRRGTSTAFPRPARSHDTASPDRPLRLPLDPARPPSAAGPPGTRPAARRRERRRGGRAGGEPGRGCVPVSSALQRAQREGRGPGNGLRVGGRCARRGCSRGAFRSCKPV